jgi:hypothetical protein
MFHSCYQITFVGQSFSLFLLVPSLGKSSHFEGKKLNPVSGHFGAKTKKIPQQPGVVVVVHCYHTFADIDILNNSKNAHQINQKPRLYTHAHVSYMHTYKKTHKRRNHSKDVVSHKPKKKKEKVPQVHEKMAFVNNQIGE